MNSVEQTTRQRKAKGTMRVVKSAIPTRFCAGYKKDFPFLVALPVHPTRTIT